MAPERSWMGTSLIWPQEEGNYAAAENHNVYTLLSLPVREGPLSCEWGSCLAHQEVLGETRMDHNYRYLLFINEWGPQKRFFHCREFKGRKSWNKSLKNRFSYDRYRESPAYKQVLLQGPINNLFQMFSFANGNCQYAFSITHLVYSFFFGFWNQMSCFTLRLLSFIKKEKKKKVLGRPQLHFGRWV